MHALTVALPVYAPIRLLNYRVRSLAIEIFMYHRAHTNPNTKLPVLYRRNCCFSRETGADIADLDGGSVAEITFPNPNNLTSFKVKVRPKNFILAVRQIVFF